MEKTKPRKRVNLSLNDELTQKLSFFAEQRKMPLASKALEYIRKGIKDDEDQYWSVLAEKRYDEFISSGEEPLTFDAIWKKHTS